jgi:hypothetical protein
MPRITKQERKRRGYLALEAALKPLTDRRLRIQLLTDFLAEELSWRFQWGDGDELVQYAICSILEATHAAAWEMGMIAAEDEEERIEEFKDHVEKAVLDGLPDDAPKH